VRWRPVEVRRSALTYAVVEPIRVAHFRHKLTHRVHPEARPFLRGLRGSPTHCAVTKTILEWKCLAFEARRVLSAAVDSLARGDREQQVRLGRRPSFIFPICRGIRRLIAVLLDRIRPPPARLRYKSNFSSPQLLCFASERSNFENRTQSMESRASERNGPFGE
jgi:hypothetical protein